MIHVLVIMISPDYFIVLDKKKKISTSTGKIQELSRLQFLISSKKSKTSKTKSSAKYVPNGMMFCLVNCTIYIYFFVGDALCEYFWFGP